MPTPLLPDSRIRPLLDEATALFVALAGDGPVTASVTAAVARRLTEHPGTGEALRRAGLRVAEAAAELLSRYADDSAIIVGDLLDGVDPGPVTSLRPGLGDPHRGGRTVTLVEFAGGQRIVYKPRDVDGEVLTGEAVAWLAHRLPTPRLLAAGIVARAGYGWMAHVAPAPVTDGEQAAEFYRRSGVLLALCHALHATDVHRDNLVAHGAYPVLIDAETLLHPVLPSAHGGSGDPAATMLDVSVRRTGLLPQPSVTVAGPQDLSGLGGDGTNRPRLNGTALEPAAYRREILDGFTRGYDAIRAEKDSFAALLRRHADGFVRIVARQSSGYAQLLAADDFAPLEQASVGHPLWSRLVPYEIADLVAGDIPVFTCRAGSTDGHSSSGGPPPGLVSRSGLDSALTRLAGLDELDRAAQEWVVTASLATRPAAPTSDRPAEAPSAVAAEPSRLLAAACGLADRIVATAATDASGRINWPGLQLVSDRVWMVLPMGAALGDGYCGVALFLAQLSGVTGIERYAHAAKQAMAALPELLSVLSGRPDLVAAVGPGAYDGLGGIAYATARMARLLDDPQYAEITGDVCELMDGVATNSTGSGWAAGDAGGLAALLAVAAELPDTGAAVRAADFAARLTAQVHGDPVVDPREHPATAGSPHDAAGGFAGGPEGIGVALAAYAAIPGAPGAAEAARAAQLAVHQAAPAPDGDLSWCTGQAGRLAARHLTALPSHAGTGPVAVADRPRPDPGSLGNNSRDHSLGYGGLGHAETMLLREPDSTALRRHAGLLLDRVTHQTERCATPGGVPTSDLLRGLAGIGYGLLRLGFPHTVPSALLLHPTPSRRSTQ